MLASDFAGHKLISLVRSAAVSAAIVCQLDSLRYGKLAR
jgi:hypothetical protein